MGEGDRGTETIDAENGHEYPTSVYEETSRACYNSQDCVTRAFCGGKLPTHNTAGDACKLYSSRNFKAYQYPDGRGEVKHYSTTELIRTRSGLIINNDECWSKGWARCAPAPASERDAALPLTTLDQRKFGSRFDIEAVEKRVDGTDYTAVHYNATPKVVVLKDGHIKSSGADLFEALEAAYKVDR